MSPQQLCLGSSPKNMKTCNFWMIPILSSQILCLSRFLPRCAWSISVDQILAGAMPTNLSVSAQRHESSSHRKRGIVVQVTSCSKSKSPASRLIPFTKQAQLLLMHFFDFRFLEPYNIHVSLCIGSASWYHLSISMSFTFSRRTPCIPWNPTVKELDRALDPNRQICYSIQFIGFICILTEDAEKKCQKKTDSRMSSLFGVHQVDRNKASGRVQTWYQQENPWSFGWKDVFLERKWLEELLCSQLQLSFWRCKKTLAKSSKRTPPVLFPAWGKGWADFFWLWSLLFTVVHFFTTIKASNFPVSFFYYRGTLNGLKETMTSLVMAYHAESASTEQLSGFPKQHLDMICNVCINRCQHVYYIYIST